MNFIKNHFDQLQKIVLNDYYRDQEYVCIVFFASYIPPCRGIIPKIIEIQQSCSCIYFVFLSSEYIECLLDFKKKMEPADQRNSNILNQLNILLDVDQHIYNQYMQQYDIQELPHCIITTKQNLVLYQGGIMGKEFDQQIIKLQKTAQ